MENHSVPAAGAVLLVHVAMALPFIYEHHGL
jgi:hypothetical protein